MTDEDCSICGESLSSQFNHILNCNHKFHYECLMKTFNYSSNKNKRSCPLCRKQSDYLPIVNGLKKVLVGVHVPHIKYVEKNKNKNISCQFILTRGKNKGKLCNKNCVLGYEYCKNHYLKQNN